MRKPLIEIVIDAATEWADQNNVDGKKTIDLRKHLRNELEKAGLSSKVKLSKDEEKQEIIALIKVKPKVTIREMAKHLGYKGCGQVGYLMSDLKQEKKVSYSVNEGWSVNETEN